MNRSRKLCIHCRTTVPADLYDAHTRDSGPEPTPHGCPELFRMRNGKTAFVLLDAHLLMRKDGAL